MKSTKEINITIIEGLLEKGMKHGEIIKHLGLKRSTYYKYVNEIKAHAADQKKAKSGGVQCISLRNYLDVVTSRYNYDKRVIAYNLMVSLRSLNSFESAGNRDLLAKLMHIKGNDRTEIRYALKIKSPQELDQILSGVLSLQNIKDQLAIIRNVLSEFSSIDTNYSTLHYRINHIVSKVDELIQLSPKFEIQTTDKMSDLFFDALPPEYVD